MLSNPTNNLHIRQRQRQHRRQNSTPSAFEPVKVPDLPNIRKYNGHRRGMSLDQRGRKTPPQERMVSHLNTGYLSAPQHILRETQQQRLVRPGQQYIQYNSEDAYLSSPIVTPHRLSLDANYPNTIGENLHQSSSFAYLGPIGWNMGVEQTNTHENNDFNILTPDPALASSNYLEFASSLEGRIGDSVHRDYERGHAGRRISEGIIDRVSQFETLALQSPQRPLTPSGNNEQSCYPPTPINTPHMNMIKQEQTISRFMDDYDTSMEETIKPSIKQRSCGIFDDMRKQLEMNTQPSLPGLSRVKDHISFDSNSLPVDNFMNLSNLNVELPDNENQFGQEPFFSPDSTDISSVLSGYQSCPEEVQCSMISDPFMNASNLKATSMIYPEPVNKLPLTSLSPRRKPVHRRFDSTSTINLEDSITETGVTTDEIASYISGPDPGDGGKWLCMYPNCRKRFGRKENIKSHVQTHLGDRQFQCPFCKKCFVRQHDLKRHAKIHSGVKPYPCQCGNSFARHDALTRHRQRGMCIGAFEGTVKKAAKRGRPRKNRPDDEERLKKSSRTLRKNQEMSASSSVSGYSESGDNSPRSDNKDFSDMNSCVDLQYHQAPLSISNSTYQNIHQQISATNHIFSSDVESHSSRNLESSQISDARSISDITTVPDANHHGEEALNMSSYNSSPRMYESLSSPESLSNYFDLEPSQNGGDIRLNIPGVPNLCSREDNLLLDIFPTTGQNPDLSNSGSNHELVMGKYVDSLNEATGEDGLFSSSQDFFYDAV